MESRQEEKQRELTVLVERRVLQRIANVVRSADDNYGGDRAAEEARLNDWQEEKNKKWQALVVRVGERRILQWWLDVCEMGKRWLADGADVAELWENEGPKIERLEVQSLVKTCGRRRSREEKATSRALSESSASESTRTQNRPALWILETA